MIKNFEEVKKIMVDKVIRNELTAELITSYKELERDYIQNGTLTLTKPFKQRCDTFIHKLAEATNTNIYREKPDYFFTILAIGLYLMSFVIVIYFIYQGNLNIWLILICPGPFIGIYQVFKKERSKKIIVVKRTNGLPPFIQLIRDYGKDNAETLRDNLSNVFIGKTNNERSNSIKVLRHTIYELYGDDTGLLEAAPNLALICNATVEEIIAYVKGRGPYNSGHIARCLVDHLKLNKDDYHTGEFL